VTPATLTNNWNEEFRKWLGVERIRPTIINDGPEANKQRLSTFRSSATAVAPVLIISYEQIRNHVALLKGTNFGLLICDEAHRLKNNESQTRSAIDELGCSRRIAISGTPLQNSLDEFYSMCNFVCPGVLSPNDKVFVKEFINPIKKSRERTCTPSEKELGEARLETVGERERGMNNLLLLLFLSLVCSLQN
jgi:SNF2 family DNA or RNA helicase